MDRPTQERIISTANKQKTAKSPYQRHEKTPFKYSNLNGLEHKRMLVREFGANYWIRVDKAGKALLDRDGSVQRMFPHEAYL